MKRISRGYLILLVMIISTIFINEVKATVPNPCSGNTTVYCIWTSSPFQSCGQASCLGTGHNGRCGASPATCTEYGQENICHDCNLNQ